MFETAKPSTTLSAPLHVSADPSWVLFLDDGMDRAVAVNSLGPPGYSLIDVANPSAPAVLDTVSVAGIAYSAAPGRSPNEILLAVYAGLTTSLQLFDVDTGQLIEQIDAQASGLPLGIAFDPIDELALVPAPASRALIVADFATGEHRVLDWQDQPGPTYVSLE